MDVNEIKEILKAVAELDVVELEIEREGVRLRVRRGRTASPAEVGLSAPTPSESAVSVASAPTPAPTPGAVAPAAPTAAPPAAAPATIQPEGNGLAYVKSPIVGTFYRAADPNAPPFVNVGDRVRAGQVLCIVEAMKLMNEIESEIGGEIVQVLAENGQPVQYGDELFVIRPER